MACINSVCVFYSNNVSHRFFAHWQITRIFDDSTTFSTHGVQARFNIASENSFNGLVLSQCKHIFSLIKIEKRKFSYQADSIDRRVRTSDLASETPFKKSPNMISSANGN